LKIEQIRLPRRQSNETHAKIMTLLMHVATESTGNTSDILVPSLNLL